LHNKFDLKDLTYHEAIPGHVWQGEYTFKQSLIRSMLAFNAYSEGWALYAQQIADELGVYADSPAGRLGYLQSLGFRACRLVVDTGLHAKGWTRQQANEWFVENNGSLAIRRLTACAIKLKKNSAQNMISAALMMRLFWAAPCQ